MDDGYSGGMLERLLALNIGRMEGEKQGGLVNHGGWVNQVLLESILHEVTGRATSAAAAVSGPSVG